MNKPFVIKYKEFWANVQAMIFYPFQTQGPFIVAAMPALFTGHSVYTWYAETSSAWLAMLISCVVAIAMEAININVVHTSLDLFEQRQTGKGWLMVFFSLIVMSLVSTVIGFSEDALSPLIKGLAVSSPWLTGIIYLAVGMAQSINQERQQVEIETQDKRKEEAEEKAFQRQLKLEKLNRDYELKLAKVEAKKSVPKVSQTRSMEQSQDKSLETMKPLILDALADSSRSKAQIARDLGLSRTQLYRHLGTLHETGDIIKNGHGYEVKK